MEYKSAVNFETPKLCHTLIGTGFVIYLFLVCKEQYLL